MNFPLDEPIFQFFYWLVNTPGIGSAAVGLLTGTAVVIFVLTLRWIAAGRRDEEEAWPYPPQH